ncbi:MAG: sortase, partial [Chloroflexi bacterium]
QERLRRYDGQGRRLPVPEVEAPRQHEAAENLPPLEPPVTYDITDDVPRFEDEVEEERPRKPTPRPQEYAQPAPIARRSRKRAVWDRFLLAVEIVGVLAFAGLIGYGAYYLTRENDKIDKKMDALRNESAAMQQEYQAMRATPTPAPELRVRLSDYLLPGNHASPEDTGGIWEPNYDELNDLPASVQQAAQFQFTSPQAALTTTAPASANTPVRIEIPNLDPPVDTSIYGGDDWLTLIKGVGHMTGTANAGERGNMVLTAHNDIYGEIFKNIQYLEPGDVFYVTSNNGQRYTYEVTYKQDVEPTEVWVLADDGNKATATLITCHPYRVDNRRMVVFAELRAENA